MFWSHCPDTIHNWGHHSKKEEKCSVNMSFELINLAEWSVKLTLSFRSVLCLQANDSFEYNNVFNGFSGSGWNDLYHSFLSSLVGFVELCAPLDRIHTPIPIKHTHILFSFIVHYEHLSLVLIEMWYWTQSFMKNISEERDLDKDNRWVIPTDIWGGSWKTSWSREAVQHYLDAWLC